MLPSSPTGKECLCSPQTRRMRLTFPPPAKPGEGQGGGRKHRHAPTTQPYPPTPPNTHPATTPSSRYPAIPCRLSVWFFTFP